MFKHVKPISLFGWAENALLEVNPIKCFYVHLFMETTKMG